MGNVIRSVVRLPLLPVRFVWNLLWRRVFLSSFMAGLGVWVPIALTVALAGWLGSRLVGAVGPGTYVGDLLQGFGLRIVEGNERVATAIGWLLVVLGIWLTGLLVMLAAKSKARGLVQGLLDRLDRVPAFGVVHKTVKQVVTMMLGGEGAVDLKKMSVVMCRLGGAGVLGLLTTPQTYRIDGRDYKLVFVSSAPMPMTGGLLLVGVDAVHPLDMPVEDFAKVYMTIGLMAPNVLPPLPPGTALPD